METVEIIRFCRIRVQVDPAALDMLGQAVRRTDKKLLCSIDSSVIVIGAEHIRGAPVIVPGRTGQGTR